MGGLLRRAVHAFSRFRTWRWQSDGSLVLCCLVFLNSQIKSLAIEPKASSADNVSIAEGKKLFEKQTCAGCHPAGGNLLLPDKALKGPEFLAQFKDDKTIVAVVRSGVPNSAMPSFNRSHLSDQDLGKIIKYIRSLSLAKPAGEEKLSAEGAQALVAVKPDTSKQNVRTSADGLRRLDFRITGKSCAVCLLGIQKRVKAMPGVVKVAVMLKAPYGVSIIYESAKTDQQKLLAAVKQGDPKIKPLDVNDCSIAKMPAALIPPHNKMAVPFSDVAPN
jgi:mono/diheme cytochrome c family protein/copper chaperone CopZ